MNLEELVRPNILALTPYSSARHEFSGPADIFLDANESPFQNGYNRYPDPYQKRLKEQIGRLKNINPHHLVLGNGSDEIIDLLIRIFCRPGQDHIVICPPTYGMYQVYAEISDVKVLSAPLMSDFQLDLLAIDRLKKYNPKLLFIGSPNNPTGHIIDVEQLKSVVTNFAGIVVLDEAYIDFAQSQSWSGCLNEYENLVVMQTLSKAWGLAAIRLGIAITNRSIVQLLNRVKPPYNINLLTQEKALEVLENREVFDRNVGQIIANRKELTYQLASDQHVQKVYPSEANFLLVKFKVSADDMYNHLVNNQIIVRNRSNVIGCDNCLRITVGTRTENEQLISLINDFEVPS